jgi:GMP synthase (glutamine-hydrolysing)
MRNERKIDMAYAEASIAAIKNTVGSGRALCALSGGVDSTVCAALMSRAIGQNLICIFVDTGLMRLNEGDEVEKLFHDNFNSQFIRINAEDRFLGKLAGVTDPEAKRKIIGEEFIRIFEEEAKKLGTVDFLVQGTIYPDIAESGDGTHALVKSHHNVGGLPDVIDFKQIIEPLRELYKDEVRKLGTLLGMPDTLVHRQPFPGPGLAVRVIGEITKPKLDILRHADHIFREEIARAGLSTKIWQYFAVITDTKSVGMQNNSRTYGHVIALRAVHSRDATAAEIAQLPYDLLAAIVGRITGEVPGAARIVYDITPKPPGTIEWE